MIIVKMSRSLVLCLMVIYAPFLNAQCADGEVEVEIEVESDQYGYETYWELVPAGNDCGEGSIFSGGNTLVGCEGAGNQQVGQGNGYGNNETFTEGPFCLVSGGFDIIFIDDWGDGGLSFNVIIGGISIAEFSGTGASHVFTFNAQEPFEYDIAIENVNFSGFASAEVHDVVALVSNRGTETITSFDFSYAQAGQSGVNATIFDVNIMAGESVAVTHPTPLNLTAATGVIDVDFNLSLPNGEEDQNPDDNDLNVEINIVQPIPDRTDDYLNGVYVTENIATSSDQVNYPTDLDFHPNYGNKELWILNRHANDQGGSTVTIANAGENNQTETWKQDGNAYHFMSYPTGIAFSNNTNFATSHGVWDANHNASEPNGSPFTGPSLWSSDLDIYAEPSGGNGSHLDMLHESPRAQGIAAESENIFWILDGHSGDIVRYDFKEDHGPGNDYHGDGVIRRYALDAVEKDPQNQVVSHMVMDSDKRWLYAVDHGNQRVIRLDITTGSISTQQPSYPATEALAEYSVCTGYTSAEIISDLSSPSGIEIIEDHLYVSDYETGVISIYDVSESPAQLMGSLETGFSSLQGIKLGPDGLLWGVDMLSSTAFRLQIESVSVSEEIQKEKPLFYPNPANESLVFYGNVSGEVSVYDTQGKLLISENITGSNQKMTLDALSRGVYSVVVVQDDLVRTQMLIKQ